MPKYSHEKILILIDQNLDCLPAVCPTDKEIGCLDHSDSPDIAFESWLSEFRPCPRFGHLH